MKIDAEFVRIEQEALRWMYQQINEGTELREIAGYFAVKMKEESDREVRIVKAWTDLGKILVGEEG